MPRKPRIEIAGYYHIINRGVEQRVVFKETEDYEYFEEIMCLYAKNYNITIHNYCLMSNHYHLLIELNQENLSKYMRQLNMSYAIYFNKKYKRTGHLWQGRYKSWYIINEEYLYSLFRYIEHNPLKAKMYSSIGEYPFTLLATLLNKEQDVISCAKHSKLKKEYYHKGIQELLEQVLSKKEQQELEEEQKKKIVEKEYEFKQIKETPLKQHFKNSNDLPSRNSAILKALKDGYTQGEIARYLDVSAALVSHVFRSLND